MHAKSDRSTAHRIAVNETSARPGRRYVTICLKRILFDLCSLRYLLLKFSLLSLLFKPGKAVRPKPRGNRNHLGGTNHRNAKTPFFTFVPFATFCSKILFALFCSTRQRGPSQALRRPESRWGNKPPKCQNSVLHLCSLCYLLFKFSLLSSIQTKQRGPS